ncbi:hypothetical protein ACPCAG_19620 [Streptomyces pseudogriseolus]|uniref:hypothetical protein n=1 Tax=Streptomyces pseudogriseolus TaxID=36817 RepID=UPI003FA22A6E
MDAAPFSPTVVKAAFRDVTWMHVSRPAVRAAASVTQTLLTEIIEGATAAAAEEGVTKLRPRHLVTAIDRNVEVDVANEWYAYSPTFRALDGNAQTADVPSRSGSARRRKSSAVVGAHRFEPGVRALLRSHRVRAVPAMVRELDGIAGVFVAGLARGAAMVVREGGVQRFGSVILTMPGEPAPALSPEEPLRAASAREGDRRTIGTRDVLDATTFQLFGSTIRQRALTEARQAAHAYASA